MNPTTYLGCPPVSSGIIGQIVGRCHVSESTLAVVRYVLSRMNGERKGFLKNAKHQRRYTIAAAIQQHRENRIEYRQVMARSTVEFVPRYFFDKETNHVLIAPNLQALDMCQPFSKAV
jgi:predicted transcriptional regulator